jgi:hypothetical protein
MRIATRERTEIDVGEVEALMELMESLDPKWLREARVIEAQHAISSLPIKPKRSPEFIH